MWFTIVNHQSYQTGGIPTYELFGKFTAERREFSEKDINVQRQLKDIKMNHYLIVLLFLASCTSLVSQHSILPDAQLCKTTETGWSCVLTKDRNMNMYWPPSTDPTGEKYVKSGKKYVKNGKESNDPTENFHKMNKYFKAACEQQGGRWKCYGMCMPTYERYCDFQLEDAGKSCTNSSQCRGKCIPQGVCIKNCVGQCSEYPLRYCDSYSELMDGVERGWFISCH